MIFIEFLFQFHKLASLLFYNYDGPPPYITTEDCLVDFFNCDSRLRYMATPALGRNNSNVDNEVERNNLNYGNKRNFKIY